MLIQRVMCGCLLLMVGIGAQVGCEMADSLLAMPRLSKESQLALLECDPSYLAQMKKPPAQVVQRAVELDCANLALVKKMDKKLQAVAIQWAKDSARCVLPLFEKWGPKNKNWLRLRPELFSRQPQAFLKTVGLGSLSLEEKQTLFWGREGLDSLTCHVMWDSVGASVLFPSYWKTKAFAFDSVHSGCKVFLKDSLVAFLNAHLEGDSLRARLLSGFPDLWQKQYGDSATVDEKARYVTHPAVNDSAFCSYADWTTPDQLVAWGISANACEAYIQERFGEALFMLQFRKHFNPTVQARLLKQMEQLDSVQLDEAKPFLDTLGRLLGSVENWDFIDTLEERTVKMLAKTPQALRFFQDPTAPMILAAANTQLKVLCSYPVTDRMLSKILMDRLQEDLPMPSEEELRPLQECLSSELWGSLSQMLQQIQAQE